MPGGAQLIHLAGARDGGDAASPPPRLGWHFGRRSFNGVGSRDGVDRKAVQLFIVVGWDGGIALIGVRCALQFQLRLCGRRAKTSLSLGLNTQYTVLQRDAEGC